MQGDPVPVKKVARHPSFPLVSRAAGCSRVLLALDRGGGHSRGPAGYPRGDLARLPLAPGIGPRRLCISTHVVSPSRFHHHCPEFKEIHYFNDRVPFLRAFLLLLFLVPHGPRIVGVALHQHFPGCSTCMYRRHWLRGRPRIAGFPCPLIPPAKAVITRRRHVHAACMRTVRSSVPLKRKTLFTVWWGNGPG